MPRKTRKTRTTEQSTNQLLKTLDDIRLTMNDVKFSVRLMAVHQEATLRTIQRWVHRLEEQGMRRAQAAADDANAKIKLLLSSIQRQGSPEASSEPERSCAIAGPSTPASSSGSIM